MEIKTKATKIGDSYFLLIPKSIIDVYSLLNWINDYDFRISVYNNGRTISYKRIKREPKDSKEIQTKIGDFKKNDQKLTN